MAGRVEPGILVNHSFLNKFFHLLNLTATRMLASKRSNSIWKSSDEMHFVQQRNLIIRPLGRNISKGCGWNSKLSMPPNSIKPIMVKPTYASVTLSSMGSFQNSSQEPMLLYSSNLMVTECMTRFHTWLAIKRFLLRVKCVYKRGKTKWRQ